MSELCGGKKKMQRRRRTGSWLRKRKMGEDFLSVFEHKLRYSGGTRTLEARISLKCSYIKAHFLSHSFLISVSPLQSSLPVFTAPPQ